jgi:hypothetical protein
LVACGLKWPTAAALKADVRCDIPCTRRAGDAHMFWSMARRIGKPSQDRRLWALHTASLSSFFALVLLRVLFGKVCEPVYSCCNTNATM